MSGIDEQGRNIIPCRCWEIHKDVLKHYWRLYGNGFSAWIASPESVQFWNDTKSSKTAIVHLKLSGDRYKSIENFCNEHTYFECGICGELLADESLGDMLKYVQLNWEDRVGGI